MIRQCSLEDDDIVRQIWALQHIAYRMEAQLIGVKELPPLMDTVESIRRCGETFYGYFNEEEEIQGVVAVEEEKPDTLTVSRMMVHPAASGRGIASQLLSYVFEQYPQVPLYIVSTGTKNEPAVGLYRKHGFQPIESFEVAPGVELTTFHRHNPDITN
ncbi:GNAT family N-acetyltransferase [Paenibacillus wulumuqiensis]|uniref:GNAT family N-acetyltransferase n=1 Tax=Paenibacillus wulumuqiensis TaxID=1567107 RepID=UPI0006193FA0|nr:GNAT family N-acetyltransferase [Paenibacillus wulumuqiensis]